MDELLRNSNVPLSLHSVNAVTGSVQTMKQLVGCLCILLIILRANSFLLSEGKEVMRELLQADCSWWSPGQICYSRLRNSPCFRFGCNYCRCVHDSESSSLVLECKPRNITEVPCEETRYLGCHMAALVAHTEPRYERCIFDGTA